LARLDEAARLGEAAGRDEAAGRVADSVRREGVALGAAHGWAVAPFRAGSLVLPLSRDGPVCDREES